MPEPMPEIEVGDWVLLTGIDQPLVRVEGTDFDAGDGEKMPYGNGFWFMPSTVLEQRKANGTVWRRDGGQP